MVRDWRRQMKNIVISLKISSYFVLLVFIMIQLFWQSFQNDNPEITLGKIINTFGYKVLGLTGVICILELLHNVIDFFEKSLKQLEILYLPFIAVCIYIALKWIDISIL